MKPLTRDWVKKAENDFKVAEFILKSPKNRVPDGVCFHFRQWIEKYLKVRMVEAGLSFPKTHNLFVLVNLCCVVEPTWQRFAKALDAITGHAVDSRYPGHSATLREARVTMKHCRIIRTAARHSLGLKA